MIASKINEKCKEVENDAWPCGYQNSMNHVMSRLVSPVLETTAHKTIEVKDATMNGSCED